MKLLKNEEVIISSNANKIVLTNNRIMMSDEVLGKSFKISIFLEDISSIETYYKSNIVFLVIGIILVIAGLIMSSQGGGGNSLISGIIIGVVFIALWWFSRKHLVSISSDGGKSLNFIVEKMTDDNVEDFVTKVQEAKLKRVNELFKV